MAEGVILKSGSYEPDGDAARTEKLEKVLEGAGLEITSQSDAGSDGSVTGTELPRKPSRRQRAIDKATAPLLRENETLKKKREAVAGTGQAGDTQPDRNS